MKQCPSCKNTYTDDSLQFCLADGTPLIAIKDDAPPTVQMSFEKKEPVRVDIPNDSAPTVFAQPSINRNPQFQQNQPIEKKGVGLIIAGVLGLFLLLVVGGAIAYSLIPRSGDNKNSIPPLNLNTKTTATVAPSVSPTASPNDETAKLKEEMEKLKKQLENQKNQKSSANNSTVPPYDNGRTAYANSPGDGFLALRSEPSSEEGERVARIPHGAALTVIDCPRPSNVGKIPGRWCRVVYNGQAGWAFDGFMRF